MAFTPFPGVKTQNEQGNFKTPFPGAKASVTPQPTVPTAPVRSRFTLNPMTPENPLLTDFRAPVVAQGSSQEVKNPQFIKDAINIVKDPLNLKENILTDPRKAVDDVWNALKDPVLAEADAIRDLFESGNDPTSLGTAKMAGAGLRAVAGAGSILFSPITALFEGANSIPVLGTVTKLISLPFQAVGEAGIGTANEIVAKLPISDEAKEQIAPGLGEIFALAGQLALGKAVPAEKVESLKKRYGEADAKVIVEKAVEMAQEKMSQVKEALPEFPGQKANEKITVKKMEQAQQGVEPVKTVEIPKETFVEGEKVKPVGEGATKTSSLAKSLEAKAIEKDLTKGFGELPEYKTANMKEQAKLAMDLLEKDPDLARRIAMGEQAPPKGLIPEAVLTAVENRAIARGDIATIRDLATKSELSLEATGMGQRIRTLAERNPDSPVGAIAEIKALREAKVKDAPKKIRQESDIIRAEIRKRAPTKETWSSFVDSLKC